MFLSVTTCIYSAILSHSWPYFFHKNDRFESSIAFSYNHDVNLSLQQEGILAYDLIHLPCLLFIF